MFQFANIEMLWWLIIIHILIVAFILITRHKRRQLLEFGDAALTAQLMPDASKSRPIVKFVLMLIALVLLIFAAARPQFGQQEKHVKRQGIEVMVALDISNSMLAEDVAPNRLDRAKQMLSKMIDNMEDDKVGLVVFAGDAFTQLPITCDYVSAKMFLNSISTESVPVQGTAIGEAINTAIRSFSAQSQKSRAVVVITDGENHEDDPIAAAKQAAELGVRVFTIGVGSPEGKPIPMDGELLKDKEGNIVVTRLDEKVLQDVAAAGDGLYVRAGNSEFGLNPIIDDIKKMEDEKYNSIVFEEFDEQFMYFLAIALCFFVVEMLIGDRRSKRHLFKR